MKGLWRFSGVSARWRYEEFWGVLKVNFYEGLVQFEEFLEIFGVLGVTEWVSHVWGTLRKVEIGKVES